MATRNQAQEVYLYREREQNNTAYGGCHLSHDQVRAEHRNQYTSKAIAGLGQPDEDYNVVAHYPKPVEFHVSTISHLTIEPGFTGILDSGGFKRGKKYDLLWFGIVISPDEIEDAEKRYLETNFPDRSEKKRRKQKPFLDKFTTSPVFQEESRYGNFRFTFQLVEVLEEYSNQFCGGQEPVLRVYETVVYKQEIMYSVLVHSPDVEDYHDYPLLGDGDGNGVCGYKDGKIIWHAEAISNTHSFRLIEEKAQMLNYEEVQKAAFYMWDHVTLAFHVPDDNIFTFPREKLIASVTPCPNVDPETGLFWHEERFAIGKDRAAQIIQEQTGNDE